MLARSCNEQAVDLSQSGVLLAPVAQELVLVASVPLTDEPWEPLGEGRGDRIDSGLGVGAETFFARRRLRSRAVAILLPKS